MRVFGFTLLVWVCAVAQAAEQAPLPDPLSLEVALASAPADLPATLGSGTGPVVSFDVPVPGPGGKHPHAGMIAGSVSVDTTTGLVTLDGRPLNADQHAELRARCFGR